MKTEQQIKSLLREWVIKKNSKVTREEIQDDTPILEKRIISSVQIMDLILYLEYLRGQPIDVQNIQPGVFSNISTIFQAFFTEETSTCS